VKISCCGNRRDELPTMLQLESWTWMWISTRYPVTYPKTLLLAFFIYLNHLDIDPNLPIPAYFCDFLTLAWMAFLIPD
jgi:hypothetical protein